MNALMNEVQFADQFVYFAKLDSRLSGLDGRVSDMRSVGKLGADALRRISKYFKIKSIYHSNAIEGNSLSLGETRLVIEEGITITGKSLRDTVETKNLSHAIDYMEDLAVSLEKPITLSDLRQIHALILQGVDEDFAGRYRETEVKITGSEASTTRAHKIPQEMADLGNYIAEVTVAAVGERQSAIICAAAAHAWLAQIHPFIDGNGRSARILMNLILMRRGYPICIIAREDRRRYYQALEESHGGDLTELVELIAENVEESLEEWEKAAEEQQQQQEWLASLTARFQQPELKRARNEYEVWRRGMALFRGYFKQTVDAWNEQLTVGAVFLKYRDYGELDFEKYLSLRDRGSAKRTWDFDIVFQRGDQRVRYLFWYGFASYQLLPKARVVLLIGKAVGHEYEIELLKYITQPNIPDIYEVGFDIESQNFVALTPRKPIESKAETIARKFFTQVIERDFGA